MLAKAVPHSEVSYACGSFAVQVQHSQDATLLCCRGQASSVSCSSLCGISDKNGAMELYACISGNSQRASKHASKEGELVRVKPHALLDNVFTRTVFFRADPEQFHQQFLGFPLASGMKESVDSQ